LYDDNYPRWIKLLKVIHNNSKAGNLDLEFLRSNSRKLVSGVKKHF